ncbi:hypothetical protein [Aeromonas sp. MdU4]
MMQPRLTALANGAANWLVEDALLVAGSFRRLTPPFGRPDTI